MSEILIPDTVEELLKIWEVGTAEETHFLTETAPERGGCLQMLQATKKGLVVVAEMPVIAKFPQHPDDPIIETTIVFHVAKTCRDDLYRVFGPGAWRVGRYLDSSGDIDTYYPNDVVNFNLTLRF